MMVAHFEGDPHGGVAIMWAHCQDRFVRRLDLEIPVVLDCYNRTRIEDSACRQCKRYFATGRRLDASAPPASLFGGHDDRVALLPREALIIDYCGNAFDQVPAQK